MGDVIMLLERLAERPSIRASRSAFFFDLACPFSYLTAERVERALSNFFRPGNLIALREIALRQVSHVVDRGLESYLEKEHIEQHTPLAEKFAVCISSNPAAQYLMARAARMAARSQNHASAQATAGAGASLPSQLAANS